MSQAQQQSAPVNLSRPGKPHKQFPGRPIHCFVFGHKALRGANRGTYVIHNPTRPLVRACTGIHILFLHTHLTVLVNRNVIVQHISCPWDRDNLLSTFSAGTCLSLEFFIERWVWHSPFARRLASHYAGATMNTHTENKQHKLFFFPVREFQENPMHCPLRDQNGFLCTFAWSSAFILCQRHAGHLRVVALTHNW